MPASNFTQLFDFEGNLERGFQDWLAEQMIDARIGGEPLTLGDDYIGATVEIGATTEHAMDIGGGALEYDQYNFTMNVDIRSRRNGEVESQTEGVMQRHRELVALVRTWLAVSQAKPNGNLNAYLPYNEIQFLRPSGTSYSPSLPNYDETTLSFTGQFSILPNAWPDAMVLSGSDESDLNTLWTRNGSENSKPKYTFEYDPGGGFSSTDIPIYFDEFGQWILTSAATGFAKYYGRENVASPDLVTLWETTEDGIIFEPADITVRRATAADF